MQKDSNLPTIMSLIVGLATATALLAVALALDHGMLAIADGLSRIPPGASSPVSNLPNAIALQPNRFAVVLGSQIQVWEVDVHGKLHKTDDIDPLKGK